MSDHKPVHAVLRVRAKVVNKEKQQRVQQEILAMIDKWENDQAPRVND